MIMIDDKYNLLEESLKCGNKRAKKVLKILNANGIEAVKGLIKETPYKDYEDLQKMGIDATIEIPLQIKTRTEGRGCYYMKDILLEFLKLYVSGKRSNGTHKKLLKLAKDSNYETVPIFVYVWFDREGEMKEKGIWIAYNKEFCDWITGEGMSLLNDIPPSKTHTSYGDDWITKNKVLPISPMRNHPKKHLINTFSTAISPQKKWKQATLDDWL